MPTPLEELREISDRLDKVSMLGMEQKSFETYFAKIYSITRAYYININRNQYDVINIIKTTWHLLEAAIEHHKEQNLQATKNAIKIVDETIEILLQILNTSLGVNDASHSEAKETNIKLRALKACGITPTGHRKHFTIFDDATKSVDIEALEYARNNIQEFTSFVYQTASNHKFVRDILNEPQLSAAFSIYEKLTTIKPELLLIESK